MTDAEGLPQYPKARYFLWKAEWEHIFQAGEAWQHGRLRAIEKQLVLVDQETEICPGIRLLTALGHTPGHTILSVTSQGEQLLYISDLLGHPLHTEYPEWYMGHEYSPEQAIASRRHILARAAEDQARVLAFHLAFPGLGTVVTTAMGWKWNPVKLSETY